MLFNSAIFCKLAVLKKHRLRAVEIELSVPFSPHFANTFSVICNAASAVTKIKVLQNRTDLKLIRKI